MITNIKYPVPDCMQLLKLDTEIIEAFKKFDRQDLRGFSLDIYGTSKPSQAVAEEYAALLTQAAWQPRLTPTGLKNSEENPDGVVAGAFQNSLTNAELVFVINPVAVDAQTLGRAMGLPFRKILELRQALQNYTHTVRIQTGNGLLEVLMNPQ